MFGKRVRDREWEETLEKLKAGQMPNDQIGHAIVRLGKPFDEKKILRAKDVVASYLTHPDDWARHEAMWFLGSWGKLAEYKPALINALRHDPNVDNRGYAASCLAHLCRASADWETVQALKGTVENQTEDRLVRLDAYSTLLQVVRGKPDLDFETYKKDLSDIDWEWLRSLAPRKQ